MSATRPWVDAFADEMEHKLYANRHKGDREGWRHEQVGWLMARLRDEVEELASFVKSPPVCGCREAGCDHWPSRLVYRDAVIAECADVANFAMMIADVVVCGKRPPRNTHYCGNCGKPVCLTCGEKHMDDSHPEEEPHDGQ